MFKENRFIFQEFLPIKTGPSRKPKQRVYDGGEVAPEIKEAEEKGKEEEVRVAEKMLSNLEQFGIKCERCGSKNTHQTGHNDTEIFLECIDCKFKWVDQK